MVRMCGVFFFIYAIYRKISLIDIYNYICIVKGELLALCKK